MFSSLDLPALIGRTFHFARFVQTEGGIYVEPFTRLRIESHGRVFGDTPMHWAAHRNGFVLLRHGELAGISFQRAFRGMPVGYHNIAGFIPHNVCLIPEAPENWAKRIYLIASNVRFFAKTIPPLVAQLRAEGVADSEIKVVVNRSDCDRDETLDGIAHAFTRHNAWEFSALYEAPRRFDFDAAFMMHDTVRIEPGFHARAWAVPGWLNWDHCPASVLGRCCVGLYSRAYLLRINSWLHSLHGVSKSDAIIIELLAELIQRAGAACAYGGEISDWQETTDEWGTGTRRLRRVFPQLGLHKFTSLDPNLYAAVL